MNKITRLLIAGAVACAGATPVLADVPYANNAATNVINILNNSPDGRALSLTYRVYHFHSLSNYKRDDVRQLDVDKSTDVNLDLQNYTYTGIAVLTVNGQYVPDSMYGGWIPDPVECGQVTDSQSPQGTLKITVNGRTVECEREGGAFPGY